jgi:hypothetical protein
MVHPFISAPNFVSVTPSMGVFFPILRRGKVSTFGCVGVLRSGWGRSAGFWSWRVVLVSFSKILAFAFRHLLISGVSCYSCLWLELVPLVILLAAISRPGRLALPEFQWLEHSLQASSPLTGKVHRYLAFRPASWQKIRPETGPVPEAVLLWPVTEAVSFCSPHSHLCRLVSEGSGNQDGSPRCSSKAPPPWAGRTPLLWQGRYPDVWSPKLCLRSCPLGTLGVSANSTPKVTQCWCQLEGTCDPGQAGFPASLMLSQVPRDWNGTEVVFHSPVVLRSRGESSRGPWGCLLTPSPRWPGAGADWKGLPVWYLIPVHCWGWNHIFNVLGKQYTTEEHPKSLNWIP